MADDPFDDLLGLEETFYNEGYQLGLEDGTKAGRIEGRVFGLEKGFEKYVEMGRLYGRSLAWNGRLPQLQQSRPKKNTGEPLEAVTQQPKSTLANLPNNPRLEKHLRVLYALTEPDSLSTDNTEEAVSDFDDRLKRAQGKIKIIDRLTGEELLAVKDNGGVGGQGQSASTGQNIEDVDILKARH